MDEQSTNPFEPQTVSPSSKRPGFGGWLLGLFIALLLYVLSVGPANRLEQAGLISQPLVAIIYAPIIRLSLTCNAADHVYMWYLHLWGVKTYI
jgi:hypothetical protein